MNKIHTEVLVENLEDSILKPHFSFRLQGSINICFNIYHDFLSYKLFKFPLSHFHFCCSHHTSWQKATLDRKGIFAHTSCHSPSLSGNQGRNLTQLKLHHRQEQKVSNASIRACAYYPLCVCIAQDPTPGNDITLL